MRPALGCRRITAGYGCGVSPARYGVPASWAHLVAGLSEHGFEVKSRAAMMGARLPDMDHSAPPRIDGLTLEWREDPEVPEWELVAHLGGRKVGECQAWGLSRHVADRPDYRRWVIVEWIEVAESHRRQGIGRRLVREQMRVHANRGVTDALLQVCLPDPDAAASMRRWASRSSRQGARTGRTACRAPPADRLQRTRACSGTAGTRSSSTPPITNSATRLSTPVLVSPVICANTPTSSGPRIAANLPNML